MDINKCADCYTVYCSFSESDRQKLEMFDEMSELLLHLYVNYELPYGMMDIETKSKFKNTIERAKEIQEEGELWI